MISNKVYLYLMVASGIMALFFALWQNSIQAGVFVFLIPVVIYLLVVAIWNSLNW